MKKHQIVKWIIFSIAVAINVFIIVNSFINGETSAKESGTVAEVIENVINNIQEDTINATNRDDFFFAVRKIVGHFSLFLVNGVFSTLALFLFLEEKKYYKFYWLITATLVTGFVIASFSEIAQLFVVGRSGAFSDIGIDFAGYLLGAGGVVLVLFLTKHLISSKFKNI